MVGWAVLPVRPPYQFPPPLLLALSGGKAEKSERKGFVKALSQPGGVRKVEVVSEKLPQ